jgi:hypothetical protein
LIPDLKKLLKDWDFLALDSEGLSRGIIMRWNNNVVLTNSFSISLGLFTMFFNKSLGYSLSILNVYVLYEGRWLFWNSSSYQCIKYDNLVIDGDLNLTINNREVLGDSARVDMLVDFFQT